MNRHLLTGVGLCALGLVLCGLADPYWTTLLAYVGISAIAALGLSLLTGVAGMISFGQAAFVGIAAYTSGYLNVKFGLNPWWGLLIAVFLTVASAAMIGLITLRMGGHFLALSTLAWGICVFYLLAALPELGGFNGFGGITAPSIGPWSMASPRAMTIAVWVCLAVCLVAVENLLASRVGRAIRGLPPGSAIVTETFGGDLFRLRLSTLMVSAALAAIAGWLYAHQQRFINPTPFGIQPGIELLFMAVIGGISLLWGAIVGAAVVTLLKQWLSSVLPMYVGDAGQYEAVIFGVLMLVVLHHTRDGLSPLLARGIHRMFGGVAAGTALRTTAVAIDRLDPLVPATRAATSKLRLNQVSMRFGGLTAVDSVSLEVVTGKITALLGPNGAGKSTLFNIITGHLRPSAGEVEWQGRSLSALPVRGIVGHGIARTFQHVRLVPGMTVLDSVAMGAFANHDQGLFRSMLRAMARADSAQERTIRQDAMTALRQVGLDDFAHGRADELALGQQRILEIARALMGRPRLLLLDEPAAGLRLPEKRRLASLLERLRADGLGVLLVEHDMDFVMRLADRVVVMNFGRKISEGTTLHVQSDPLVVQAYLGVAA